MSTISESRGSDGEMRIVILTGPFSATFSIADPAATGLLATFLDVHPNCSIARIMHPAVRTVCTLPANGVAFADSL